MAKHYFKTTGLYTDCPGKVKILRKEQEIVDSLENADLVCLCGEAVEIGVVPQHVKDNLDSMDWENVPCPRGIRYLLMHVYRSIERNPRLRERWIKLLHKYISSTDYVLDASVILERHIPILTELLAESANKWEDISIALELPESVREDLRMKQPGNPDCILCFNQLLMKWVLDDYQHAKAPTLANLEKVLRNESVGLGAEANRLRKNQWMFGVQQQSQSLEIVRQSYDAVAVPEEKSTLLEVQVATSGAANVSYRWHKDGHQLSNGHYNNIHCVSHSSVSSKGTYKCEVSIHAITVSSRPIALEISLSPITKELVDRYLSEPEVPEDSWPPKSSNTYINLALIKQGNIDKAGDYARKTIQGNIDDILADKASIEYENTFTDLKSATRLLIEGRPGSGKTTLVHKFSQDWARGSSQLNLHNIRRLFVVHLRGFFNNEDITLRDIMELYYAEVSVVDTITKEVEKNNGDGFCFILDGLDEYRPKSMKNTFICKLIKRQVLSKAVAIIASRPAASYQFRSTASKQIEVIGFMEEQIFEYIESYPFSEAGKIGNLHKYLAFHSNVHHMCYLPIHTAMVCFLFDIMGSTLPRTETEMYTEFTNLTLLRTLKRDEDVGELEDYQSVEDLPDQDEELFLRICQLSYTKTLSSKQAMKRSEIKKFFKDVNAGRESLGLITVDRMAHKYGFENLYTFLHLTFQEYLAAYYLFKKDEVDQISELSKHGKEEHMLVVWKFYCGLAHFKEKDAIFGEIVKCSGINEDSLFGVQCAFESQQTIPCDYVVQSGECGTLSFKGRFLTPSDLTAIGYVLRNATCPVEKLVLDRCKLGLEGLNAFFAEAGEKISSVKTLCFHGKDCEMEQYQLLNTCLKSVISIEVLDLSETNLGNEKVKVLTNEVTLPNLHTLKLSSPPAHLDSKSARLLGFDHPQLLITFSDQFNVPFIQWWLFETFEFSATFFSSLGELTTQVILCNYKLQVPYIKLVTEGLKEHSSFTSLDLTNCGISDDGCEALMNGLVHCSTLKKFLVSKNRISDDGAIELGKALRVFTQLESLDISDNSVGATGIAALAESIVQCTLLQKLDMSYNSIGNIGATSLAKSLRHLSQVKVLKLAFTRMGDKGAISLAKVLNHCDKIEDLSMGGNSIGDKGVNSLANGILHCADLRKLVLNYNHIGDVGAKSLAESFNYLKGLCELDLSYNRVGDEGAIAIARAVSHLKGLKIRIWNHRISKEGSNFIASLIQDVDRNFHHLTLSGTMLQNIDTLLHNMQNDGIESNHITEIELDIGEYEVFQNETLPAIINHCSELQTFYLTLSNLDINSAYSLTEVLPKCTELKIHKSFSSNFDEALAVTLIHCNNVKALNLGSKNISAAGVKALVIGLQHCSSLKTLNLGNNNIGADGAKALSVCLQHCISLETLFLQHNSIGVNGAKALAVGLQHCSGLETLFLQHNRIGVDGAKALAVGLQHCSSLQTLNLEDNSIGADGAKALAVSLQHCSSLQTLNLEDNSIGADGAKALAVGLQHWRSLQTLFLQRNSIGADGAGALAVGLQHCSSLLTLNLEWNSIGAYGAKTLIAGLQHCSKLQTLFLQRNSIGAYGAKALAVGLQHCISLQTLNLEGNSIGADGAKALALGLKHCSSLQTLNLGSNNLCAYGTKALAVGLQHCSSLQTLNLGSNGLGADGARTLAVGLQHCSSLQTLNLWKNEICADGAKALAMHLQHCSSLQTLNLGHNVIGCVGAKAIAVGLQHCSSLQTLNLQWSAIGADGVKALIEGLQHCSSLQTLNLWRNNIGADGAKALTLGLQHCSGLQTLNLRCNSIGAGGAKALAVGLQHCSTLQTLNLEDNGIGDDGAKALAVGLQHCSSLQTLYMNQNDIGADGAKALAAIYSGLSEGI